nr:Lzipper-MIP1 domain-containing protein [Ipomoea batatas]GMD28978.1 Lzipper-MIP1 domain-containing protein [Ipomoea batatas]
MPPLLDCHSSSLPSALHSSAPNTELPSWDHVLNMSPKPSPHLNPAKNADSGHRSLADHLGVSRIDDFINYPDRLSEEIVRCIASIYCKLANPSTVTQKGSSVSSTSSMSSSSTFSPRNLSGSWSLAVEEGTEQCEYEGFKDDKKANGTPIEVLKIRVYTARNVFRDLKVAKKEFIEATVCIQKETAKIYVPKIVCYYAKDMSFSMDGLVEDMNGCLSESQQKAVKSCVKGRPEKYIDWLPQSSSFRYLIHCTEKLPKEE